MNSNLLLYLTDGSLLTDKTIGTNSSGPLYIVESAIMIKFSHCCFGFFTKKKKGVEKTDMIFLPKRLGRHRHHEKNYLEMVRCAVPSLLSFDASGHFS